MVVIIAKGRVEVRELKVAEPRFISQIYAGCRSFGSSGQPVVKRKEVKMEWPEKYKMGAICSGRRFVSRRKHSAVCKSQIGPR